MGREQLLGPLLERETWRLNHALELEVLSRAGMRALQEPLMVVALGAGVYGALTVLVLPFSTIIMLILLCTRILDCAGKAQRDYQDLVVDESAFDALQEMIQRAEPAPEALRSGATPTLRRGVRLAAVRFAYEQHPPVLCDAT